MKCPYCGKIVRDMPNHLLKNEACHEKHADKLKSDFKFLLAVNKHIFRVQPEFKTGALEIRDPRKGVIHD